MSNEAEFFKSIQENNGDAAIQLLACNPPLANAQAEVNMPGHTGDKPFAALTAAANQNLERLVNALICYGADITSQHGPNGETDNPGPNLT